MTYRFPKFQRNRESLSHFKNSILTIAKLRFCYKTLDFGTSLIEQNHILTCARFIHTVSAGAMRIWAVSIQRKLPSAIGLKLCDLRSLEATQRGTAGHSVLNLFGQHSRVK